MSEVDAIKQRFLTGGPGTALRNLRDLRREDVNALRELAALLRDNEWSWRLVREVVAVADTGKARDILSGMIAACDEAVPLG